MLSMTDDCQQVRTRILQSSIANASTIACTVTADDLIVSSTSNWGGHALAAGLTLLASEQGVFKSRGEAINICMTTLQQEHELLQKIVDVGARDGVTGAVSDYKHMALSHFRVYSR